MVKQRKRDWYTIRSEWLATNETLSEFAEKRHIPTARFHKVAAQEKWLEQREEINRRAMERASQKTIEHKAKQWANQTKLWGAMEAQVAAHIHRTIQDGKITSPINPQDLTHLAGTLEKSLKSQKLILGESTGDENRVDVQSVIVQQINLNANERKPITTDTTATQDAEIVDSSGHTEQSGLRETDARE